MSFIDPASIVAQLDLRNGHVVADFGCGSGYYAVALAKKVAANGLVYAIDVQDAKLGATNSAARHAGLKNVIVIKADLDKPLLDIEPGHCDVVVMASIVHEVNSKDMLIKNAYRLLKTGGKLAVVEWKKQATPLGPDISRRISQDELEQLLGKAGLRKDKELMAGGFHYAVLFTK